MPDSVKSLAVQIGSFWGHLLPGMRLLDAGWILLLVLPLLTWLIQGAVGPALVGVPVTWAATDLAGAAKRWFRRLRRSDGLSCIVRAAGGGLDLSDDEFAAVRGLLERESTWVEVGRGEVEDLAALIASRLPGRPGEGSLAAGRAIAGGLLEFAVRDLEPEWFRQVLFARLDRMQSDQASALDQAMLRVHADLAALLAKDTTERDRFASVLGQLARMLDRLPPGPADRGEVAVYLARLIRWLNTDLWPQDMRFAGPALAPVDIERKLQIASGGGGGEEDLDTDGGGQDLDADDLASRCSRLVVLGGPGSGKTWLARRTARLCAEAALDALAAGAGPNEVELPLYTTCTLLAAAPPGEGIRRAVVASALGQLADLGGSRVYDAVRALFEDRDAPTLLVADSLDEARGADDRIRQADTLPPAWRVVLTSRPTSWNRQLTIGGDDPSRRVGVLQPLRYPDDVEPFIAVWFSTQPGRAFGLATQLRDRPALQQAATVPLILAFYCIIGGDQPLPSRRAGLYAKVIRRMLTGRWRGSADCDPDPDACMETLRDWAWSAAVRNPVSGTGEWADDFPTPRIRQSRDDRDAIAHVAAPIGAPDPDTGMTMRRFVHRSIREHLVAEHVARRMSAQEAARELLDHIWYDPDWEYAAPAALAMHPQRDQVLRDLISRVTGRSQLPADLRPVDGCWQVRLLLDRVALESSQEDWSPEAAGMIGQARLELAKSRCLDHRFQIATGWEASDRSIRKALLGRLARETYDFHAPALANAVAGLDPTADDRTRARQALLGHLDRARDSWLTRSAAAALLAEALAGLAATPEEQAQARQALLGELARERDPVIAARLAVRVARLDPTAQDRAQARQALLGLLVGERSGLINQKSIGWHARKLADAMAGLAVTAEERTQAWQALLGHLAGQTNPWWTQSAAMLLAETVAGLHPTAQEQAQARQALLGQLARDTYPVAANQLAEALSRLHPTEQEQAQARQALLGVLAYADGQHAHQLAGAIAGFDPTAQEQAQARQALLSLLFDEPHTLQLAEALAGLHPTARDRARAREELLEMLDYQVDPQTAQDLGEAMAALAVTAEERARDRQRMLDLLARKDDYEGAVMLAVGMTRLDLTAQDRAQAREVLLGLLTRESDPHAAHDLAEAVAGLAVTAEERAAAVAGLELTALRVRSDLLDWITSTSDGLEVGLAAEELAELDPTARDRARARKALLGHLAKQTDTENPDASAVLEWALARLAVTAEERAQARKVLLRRRARATDRRKASDLTETVMLLEPTAADLGGWHRWWVPPSWELLAAVRRNSTITAWLDALPLLARLEMSEIHATPNG